jgi:hypothetical protein
MITGNHACVGQTGQIIMPDALSCSTFCRQELIILKGGKAKNEYSPQSIVKASIAMANGSGFQAA